MDSHSSSSFACGHVYFWQKQSLHTMSNDNNAEMGYLRLNSYVDEQYLIIWLFRYSWFWTCLVKTNSNLSVVCHIVIYICQ